MAIIGVNGKIGSGKDTVGKIILELLDITYPAKSCITKGNWQIHKFADALKDIICILTGCTRKQLEDDTFKNSKLGDEWIKPAYHGICIQTDEGVITENFNGTIDDMLRFYLPEYIEPYISDKKYEYEQEGYIEIANKDITFIPESSLTYREILQYIGTDLLRNQLHEDCWINALMSKYYITHYMYGNTPFIMQKDNSYKPNDLNHSGMSEQDMINLKASKINGCNWIITDVRFPNEANAIKERGGINIRIERGQAINLPTDGSGIRDRILANQHPSETALDDYTFNYVIDNNGSIEELIQKVKEILIKEHMI